MNRPQLTAHGLDACGARGVGSQFAAPRLGELDTKRPGRTNYLKSCGLTGSGQKKSEEGRGRLALVDAPLSEAHAHKLPFSREWSGTPRTSAWAALKQSHIAAEQCARSHFLHPLGLPASSSHSCNGQVCSSHVCSGLHLLLMRRVAALVRYSLRHRRRRWSAWFPPSRTSHLSCS